MIEYKAISQTGIIRFNKKLKLEIAEGWAIAGEISTCNFNPGHIEYTLMLSKSDNTEGEPKDVPAFGINDYLGEYD